MSADYYYFTPRGKWKYHGEGESIPAEYTGEITHRFLRDLNNGHLPGISNGGESFDLVVIDEESWPRMVKATVRDDT